MQTTCWFCQKKPADSMVPLVFAMYAAKKSTPPAAPYPVRIDKGVDCSRIDVPIPRCRECAAAQRLEMRIFLGCFIGGGALFAALFYVLVGARVQADWVTAATAGAGVAGALVGFAIAFFATRGLGGRGHSSRDFSEVQRLMAAGWFPDRP